ncbi:hypothetical protein PORY_000598 [Pneumocystis oryctolagi]|uniref:Uncharacterized protein n=1 Tax=Pneumocystis oryctolagi TaxID=42067 RepID=A0ACB7CFC7_9ASCO|nr:hypothetical protein PORY_000598 [Pneumocystis oryctolagi]
MSTDRLVRTARLFAATVLARAPLVVRVQTPFEKAYYAYQQQLQARLAAPFPAEFYFKKGSLAEKKWLLAMQAVQAEQSGRAGRAGQPVQAVGAAQAAAGEHSEPVLLTGESNGEHSERSLERQLDQTLYLLVKRGDGEHCWQFPQGRVEDDDEALQRVSQPCECRANAVRTLCKRCANAVRTE